MIKKVNFSMRAAAANTLVDRLVAEYKNHADMAKDVFAKQTFEAVAAQNARLTTAIRQDTALREYEAGDVRRDSSGRAVMQLPQAYVRLDAYAEPAEKVVKVLEKYGTSILRAAYDEETAYLDSMLEDLAAPDLQPAIAALPGMAEAVAQLTEAHVAFKKLKEAYTQTLTGKAGQLSATDVKKMLLQQVNGELFTYLDAMAMAQPAVFAAYASTADALVREANALLTRRATLGAKNELPPTPSQGGDAE